MGTKLSLPRGNGDDFVSPCNNFHTLHIIVLHREGLQMGHRKKEGLTCIRTGSATFFRLIEFLIIFLCMVAPPLGTRSWRVTFVLIYTASYVGLTSRQSLATLERYADYVKQPFRRFSRRSLEANFSSFITRLVRLLDSDPNMSLMRMHSLYI